MTTRLVQKPVKGKASCLPIQEELNDNPKAREKLIEIQTELDSLKSVNTNGMKSSEIKNLNKKISEAEEEVKESKEKLDKKIQKSNIEKRWLNSNLSAIYNGINNYLKNNPDDDF